MVNALLLVIKTLVSLYVLAILLRFLLQAARADFYNPISQAIVKITSPLLFPFRKVIPGYRGFDFASIVLALAVSALATFVMLLLFGETRSVGLIISWAFVGLLNYILDIYVVCTWVLIIASFVAPFSGNPALLLVHQILEPITSRVRRLIPPIGALDLSALFILLGIKVIRTIVVYTLVQRLQLPGAIVVGFNI